MKCFAISLPIIGLIILLCLLIGLLGSGKCVSNLKNYEYQNGNAFIKPTVNRDDLAVYIVGEGEPILVFPYPHAGTNEPMTQSDFSDTFIALGRKVITFDVPGTYASSREPEVDLDEMLN